MEHWVRRSQRRQPPAGSPVCIREMRGEPGGLRRSLRREVSSCPHPVPSHAFFPTIKAHLLKVVSPSTRAPSPTPMDRCFGPPSGRVSEAPPASLGSARSFPPQAHTRPRSLVIRGTVEGVPRPGPGFRSCLAMVPALRGLRSREGHTRWPAPRRMSRGLSKFLGARANSSQSSAVGEGWSWALKSE